VVAATIAAVTEPAASSRPDLAAEALVWAGVAACAAGIAATGLWRQWPGGRFAESLALAALVALPAWGLRRWRGWPWAGALAAVWMLLLAAMGGPPSTLAVALLAAAAIAAGSSVAPARPMLALACGLAMLAGAAGWLVLLPLHRWWTWLPMLALIVVARHAAVRKQWQVATRACRDIVGAHPRTAAATVMLLGLASAAAWVPTLQYDDLAYHLGLPWQLMLHGRYAPDPAQQVWSYAPWAGDVLQAIAQVVAHAEARGAMNALWLLATAGALWRIGASIGLRPAFRCGAIGLYATLPLTAGLLAGMQTETAAAAVTAWLAALVLERNGGADTDTNADTDARADAVAGARRLLAGGLLFGLLCGLKPLHALAALPVLAWAGWRHRHGGWRPRELALAVVAVLAVGGSSYAYSWHATGNPVLPLLNDVFRSPWFAPVAFDDGRWHAPLGLAAPWRFVFHTRDYLEGWDGGFGLLPVALAGAWLLALADRATRGLAACALLVAALPLLALHYVRYMHPGLVLALPALAHAVQRWFPARRGGALLAVLCVAAGLAWQANANWVLHVGGPKRSLLALGRDAPLFDRYAPERSLAAAIRAQAPGSGPVLLLSEPYQAEFAGRARNIAWYSPRMQAAAAAADRDATGAAWAALLRREHIAEVILAPATLPAARRAGLARLGAQRRLAAGDAEWWRIPSAKDAR
jgi:hypothetical protein